MSNKTTKYQSLNSDPEHRIPSAVHRLPSTIYRLIFLLLLAIPACQSGPDENRIAVDAFLEQQVEERLALYQKILNQQCHDRVLEEAGKIADSILISEARLQRDSMGKPPKPTKPDKPELKHLKDSLRLDPLFRDTTQRGN